MQTVDMENRGLANRRGTIMSHRTTHCHVRVALDGDNNIEVPVSSLMPLDGPAPRVTTGVPERKYED